MKFIIGSTSERKINCAKNVISQVTKTNDIETIGYKAQSQVPDTPYDQQTFDGARNRALDAKNHISEADYWLGVESGLVERYGHIYEEAWCCIIDNKGKEFYGYSSGLKLPDYILKQMQESKMEHCDIMTLLEEKHNLKENDTWGSYSGKMILREISLEESIRNASIQIFAPKESFYHL